jgi:hypothetical protein
MPSGFPSTIANTKNAFTTSPYTKPGAMLNNTSKRDGASKIADCDIDKGNGQAFQSCLCRGKLANERVREVGVLVGVEVENEEDDGEEYFFFTKPVRVGLMDVHGWNWIYRSRT